jgi:TPR repeat protein
MSLMRGDGVTRNTSEAAEWFERAALQGQVNAQLSLGAAYINGEGVTKDPARGFAWLEVSAARGFVPAKRLRDQVRPQLSLQQRSRARDLVEEFSAKLPK